MNHCYDCGQPVEGRPDYCPHCEIAEPCPREPEGEMYVFTAIGSKGHLYDMTFQKDADGQIIAECQCVAWQRGLACKHRLGVLKGESKGLMEDYREDELQIVASWLKGSNIEKCLEQIQALEKQQEAIKKQLNGERKKLGRIMEP